MADGTDRKPTNRFYGLNNVDDPFRLSMSWLVQADNVDISKTSGLMRSNGFTRSTTNTNITGAYATDDQSRLYIVDNGELRSITPGLTGYTVLKSGLSTTLPVAFEEVNGIVYYTNGVDFGSIEPDGWRPWGIAPPDHPPDIQFTSGGSLPRGFYSVTVTHVDPRGLESGNCKTEALLVGEGTLAITNIPQRAGYTTNVYVTACNGAVFHLVKEEAWVSYSHTNENNLGRELPFFGAEPPRGDNVALFQGSLWVSEPYPSLDYSVIWSSLPLHYHHFMATQGVMVPGVVRMINTADDTMVIGTDRNIFGFTGDKMEELAPYGVVGGFHDAVLGDKLFFWSLRGLCTAMPFKNLSDDRLSVAPGSSAGAAVLEKDGMRRYVVALRQGGEPYNRR